MIKLKIIGIIGLGSIGRRHAKIIKSIYPNVSFFAYRTQKGSLLDTPENIQVLDKNIFFNKFFDLIIISNPSSLHFSTLKLINKIGNTKAVFIEKPFCLPNEIIECKNLLKKTKLQIFTGNCLRFHPAIFEIKKIIKSHKLGKILESYAHFGSYMPNWHPYENYKNSYKSRKNLGGGVLLTSIHEIDITYHLFGQGELIGSYAKNIFLHDIDVEDTAHLLIEHKKCPISNISLNFFQRPYRRYFEVIFEKGTFVWFYKDNFIRILTDDTEKKIKIDNKSDSMYIIMWKEIFKKKPNFSLFELNSVFNSLEVIKAVL